MPRCCQRSDYQQRKLRQSEPPVELRTILRSASPPLPSPKMPRAFVSRILKPIMAINEPNISFSTLCSKFKITVTGLDFATGAHTHPERPTLLRLRELNRIEDFVTRVRPWVQKGVSAYCFHDFKPQPPREGYWKESVYFENASELTATLNFWLNKSESLQPEDSLIRTTPWRLCRYAPRAEYDTFKDSLTGR